ncbi:uncharacterized protein [Penaeus vannamei]|uniref:uncharacterized protein n=1 Tax=Penaeus vannamei TaxID=6689 RepID=UPI00387F6974
MSTEELGPKGNYIAQYVISQQTLAREERAKERDFQKDQLEAEKERVKLEHELQMARLGSLLTGKVVDIYTSLPPETTADYQLLKKALLRGYSKTPASYRNDFGTAKIKSGETYEQFAIRIGQLFDYWVDSHITKDYASIRDFMLLDQLMSSISPDLRVFVKEHNVSSLADAVSLSDNWSSAHSAYPKENSKFMTAGTVNGAWVSTVLRDTRCTCVIVSDKVLTNVDLSRADLVGIKDYLGRVDYFPKTKCYLNCPYFKGWIDVVRAPIKFCSVLIGNVLGVYNPKLSPDSEVTERSNVPLDYSCAIQTRSSKHCERVGKSFLVVPSKCRAIILAVGHESPLAGHFSHRKSEMRIRDHFYWLNMGAEIRDFYSISVAEALMVIFSRVGIPWEILFDRGRQFVSQLMGELHKLLGVKPLFTTPYHPSGNGRVEMFHATLKASSRKLFSDLRDLREDTTIKDDGRSSFQYVIKLKDKMDECAKIAAQNAEINSSKFKSYFDLKSQDRTYSPGEEVLVLLPDNQNKLLMSWSGHYTVLECRNKVNYLIDEGGKRKLLHANLLKKYHESNKFPT